MLPSSTPFVTVTGMHERKLEPIMGISGTAQSRKVIAIVAAWTNCCSTATFDRSPMVCRKGKQGFRPFFCPSRGQPAPESGDAQRGQSARSRLSNGSPSWSPLVHLIDSSERPTSPNRLLPR